MSYLLQKNNLVSSQATALRTPVLNWSSDSETVVTSCILILFLGPEKEPEKAL